MKKYLLVSLTVLFAAAFLWADDVTNAEQKVGIKADATVTWGVDLGSGKGDSAKAKHGFKNEASWEVKFPLLKKGDSPLTRPENAPVYAEVVLKDIELGFESKNDSKDFKTTGKVDNISAKLVFYGAYLQVYGKPNFKTNYANIWDPIEKKDYDGKGIEFKPGFDGAGFKLGYANKNLMDLDVGLKFGSNGDWEAKYKDREPDSSKAPVYKKVKSTAETPDDKVWLFLDSDRDGNITILELSLTDGSSGDHSKYGAGFDFSMKPLGKMLGVDLTVNSTFAPAKDYDKKYKGYNTGVKQAGATKDKIAFNFGAKLTSEPIEALKFTLGFDGGASFHVTDGTAKGKETFAWDMLFDAGYKWVSGGVYVASAGTPCGGWDSKKFDKQKETADMAVYLKFHTKADKTDPSNLVEGLDAGAYLGLFRLLSKPLDDTKENNNYLVAENKNRSGNMKGYTDLPMLIKLWGSYKLTLNDSMSIKPFADVWAETNHFVRKDGTSSEKPYIGVAYDLGVTYSPVEKVEVTAKWAHGKVGKDSHAGIISAPANYRNHNGTFTLALKVEY